MAFEIIATIFAVLVLVKLLCVTFKPGIWMEYVTKPFLKYAGIMQFVYLALAIWVGFYVFQWMSIIEVTAVALLISLLMALTFFSYPKETLKFATDVRKKGLSPAWLSLIIWAVWAIWVLYVLWR